MLVRGMGWRAAFGVRGTHVLLDGVPLTLPDGQTMLNVVDASAIQRVEVVRGPASVLYGSDALGGAVNIITKNPALTLETAAMVKEAGAQVLRGGVWKPRTNPYSYQGDDRALEVLLRAREETGLPVNLEVMDVRQLRLAVEARADGRFVFRNGGRDGLTYRERGDALRAYVETVFGKEYYPF